MKTDSFVQSGLTLLSELHDSDIEWMLVAGTRGKVPANAVVVSEGAKVENIYIILQGLLSVYLATHGGKVLATIGAGHIFGEMSFLEDRPASATVRTIEDSEILTISQADLAGKLETSPQFAARFYRALAAVVSRRLREMIGTVGRWMEEEPSVEPAILDRWNEIALRTQKFKDLLVAIDKDPKPASGPPDGFDAAFREFCAFTNQAIGDESPETIDDRDELGGRIQRELLPYLLKSRTVERLYTKPRGFAGDFQAIGLFYNHQPEGQGDAGVAFDRLFLDLPPAAAIRNRRELLTEELVRAIAEYPEARVSALCSGVADELFAARERSAKPISATFLDFDTQALGTVAERIELNELGTGFTLISVNLFDLAVRRTPSILAEQDIIYSINLPDSFDDRLLLRFLNYMHRALRPGGKVILSFFHAGSPFKAFMDYIVDWKVSHWTEEQVAGLFTQSAFQKPCTNIRFEPGGIIFLAACQKS
jgi:SAM-dependent methyltransferase